MNFFISEIEFNLIDITLITNMINQEFATNFDGFANFWSGESKYKRQILEFICH